MCHYDPTRCRYLLKHIPQLVSWSGLIILLRLFRFELHKLYLMQNGIAVGKSKSCTLHLSPRPLADVLHVFYTYNNQTSIGSTFKQKSSQYILRNFSLRLCAGSSIDILELKTGRLLYCAQYIWRLWSKFRKFELFISLVVWRPNTTYLPVQFVIYFAVVFVKFTTRNQVTKLFYIQLHFVSL